MRNSFRSLPVISNNVGGHYGRKVLFFPDTGKVLMRKIEISGRQKIFKEEERYKIRLFKEKSRKAELTIF